MDTTWFSPQLFFGQLINSKSIKNLKNYVVICILYHHADYTVWIISYNRENNITCSYQTRTRVSISCAKLSIMEFYIFGQSSSQLYHFIPKKNWLFISLSTFAHSILTCSICALRVVWDFEDIVKTKNTDIHTDAIQSVFPLYFCHAYDMSVRNDI